MRRSARDALLMRKILRVAKRQHERLEFERKYAVACEYAVMWRMREEGKFKRAGLLIQIAHSPFFAVQMFDKFYRILYNS
jgi:hypothetical protein